MSEKTIEAMLASPPEREDLVVQLFLRNGGQWGEIFREGDEYWVELYRSELEPPIRLTVGELVNALTQSVDELRGRLGTS
jgi:hypothetical protein